MLSQRKLLRAGLTWTRGYWCITCHSTQMLMPKKNRIAIYELLFKEGVMVAKKDVHLAKHPELADKNVPNLHVMKAMQVRNWVMEDVKWYYNCNCTWMLPESQLYRQWSSVSCGSWPKLDLYLWVVLTSRTQGRFWCRVCILVERSDGKKLYVRHKYRQSLVITLVEALPQV